MRGVRIALGVALAGAGTFALWLSALRLTSAAAPPAPDPSALRGALLGLNVDSTRVLVTGVGVFVSLLHLLALSMTAGRTFRASLAWAGPLAIVPVAIDLAIARALNAELTVWLHAGVWLACAVAMAGIAWGTLALMRPEAPPPPPPNRPVDPGRLNVG